GLVVELALGPLLALDQTSALDLARQTLHGILARQRARQFRAGLLQLLLRGFEGTVVLDQLVLVAFQLVDQTLEVRAGDGRPARQRRRQRGHHGFARQRDRAAQVGDLLVPRPHGLGCLVDCGLSRRDALARTLHAQRTQARQLLRLVLPRHAGSRHRVLRRWPAATREGRRADGGRAVLMPPPPSVARSSRRCRWPRRSVVAAAP